MSKSVPLVLASGSPRRKDLLVESGYVFDVVIPEVEELDDPDMDIRKLTALNAKLKAEAVSPNHPEQVVIAADTLVLFENQSLGKPADMAEAAAILRRLNGNTHLVYTGVCLLKTATNQLIEFDVATEVTFKKLTEGAMKQYHSLINPLDKAGAYAAQEFGDLIIEKSVGSDSNVIGLPMEELAVHLENHFCIEPHR